MDNKKESSGRQENNSEGIPDTQDNDQHESFYTDGDPSDTFIKFQRTTYMCGHWKHGTYM